MPMDHSRMRLIRPSEEQRREAERRRLDPFMRALKAIHSAATPDTMDLEDLERQRRGQELLGRLVAPMAGMSWEPFSLDGMEAAWVRPHRGHDRRRCILYCHGGGYTSGNLGYSRILASKLAHITGYEVLAFEYRLAPEHPFPAAPDDAMKAWDYLMHLGYGARDVVVAGDSAGGNLALVLTHRLKGEGRRLPGALILMSPWTDLTASGKSCRGAGRAGPGAHPQLYPRRAGGLCPGAGLVRPLLSPHVWRPVSSPPTLIQAGTEEKRFFSPIPSG